MDIIYSKCHNGVIIVPRSRFAADVTDVDNDHDDDRSDHHDDSDQEMDPDNLCDFEDQYPRLGLGY